MFNNWVLARQSKMAKQECGCECNVCNNNDSLYLQREIEELKVMLSDSKNQISQLQTDHIDSKSKSDQEVLKLQEELFRLRDRYERLSDSHKKLQKINSNLEDKLLTITADPSSMKDDEFLNVEKLQIEKSDMFDSVQILTAKLTEATLAIDNLEEKCDRYRHDCNLAVHLLQSKPSEFVAQKLDILPLDFQDRVKSHLSKEDLEKSNKSSTSESVYLPMITFPPTAVFSINNLAKNKSNDETSLSNGSSSTIPVKLIAKVLSEYSRYQPNPSPYVCSKCGGDGGSEHSKFDDIPLTENVLNDEGDYWQRRSHSNRSNPGIHRPTKHF